MNVKLNLPIYVSQIIMLHILNLYIAGVNYITIQLEEKTNSTTHTKRTVVTVSDFRPQELGGQKRPLNKSNTTRTQ